MSRVDLRGRSMSLQPPCVLHHQAEIRIGVDRRTHTRIVVQEFFTCDLGIGNRETLFRFPADSDYLQYRLYVHDTRIFRGNF